MMKIELCAASLAAIRLARELNFDRIELCQNLEQGGITPSFGMIEYAISHGVETHVLIRPRPGGFYYSEDEQEIMLLEIVNCKQMGANGIVIGALTETGEIDEDFLIKAMHQANGMEVTFHRAFDDSYDWKKSMNVLINHGVQRILTAGLARNVELGRPVLSQMIKFSAGRIELMIGGGISAANAPKLVLELKPNAIHFSGTTKTQMDEDSLFSETILKVDEARVKRILKALNPMQNILN
jgi:copper homeostasis protein